MLQVAGVSKSFGDVRALDRVSLDVDAGEVVVLLGPNGAGKSTLVSIICGLQAPDEGHILIDGRDLAEAGAAARSHLGVAAQDVALVRTRTVRQNLRYFGALAGASSRDLDERIEEVVVDLGLGDVVDKKVLLLSGGEQRRAHVAAALVGEGTVLVLDEATSAVDLSSRTAILQRIERARDEGKAVLYTTHLLDEVAELTARVVIIDHGRVVVDLPIDELLALHAQPAVEICFSKPVRRLPKRLGAEVHGPMVRVVTADPGQAIAGVLQAVSGAEVRSIEIVRPGMAAAFLALTGRQFDPDGVDEGAP